MVEFVLTCILTSCKILSTNFLRGSTQMQLLERFSGHRAARSGVYVGRHRMHDELMTFDRMLGNDAKGNALGKPLPRGTACDGKTFDSTGAFLVGELERLDLTVHEPLVAVTWGRDIDLREDVTLADEVSSFTISTYASAGGLGAGNSIGNGKAWIGKNTDQVTGVDVDIAKTPHQLRLWGMEIKYTIPELESAAKLGRPIDQQKYDGMQLKHQMDIDEQVYIGDTSTGDHGMLTLTNGTDSVANPVNVPAGATGGTQWSTKSPDEILADINLALTTNWAASAWAVMPTRILIPPAQFGQISTQKIGLAANTSVLKYVKENNLLATAGKSLEILPLKWCLGAGAGGTVGTAGTVDRMLVYAKEKRFIRYPMTLLQRTPIQFDSIYHKSTYFCRLGVLEMVYPTTIGYYDGI
jgi:hypothetical protein